jgi:hypothetical protein
VFPIKAKNGQTTNVNLFIEDQREFETLKFPINSEFKTVSMKSQHFQLVKSKVEDCYRFIQL